MSRTPFLLTFPLLLLLGCAAVPPVPTPPLPEQLAADDTWEGTVRLPHSVTISSGLTLTLAPGTRVEAAPGAQILVQGTLRSQGTAAQPVVLTGDRETSGALIAANGADVVLELAHTEVRNAGTGVSAHGARVTLEAGGFYACGKGLVLETRATAELGDAAFEDNQVGLSVGNTSRCTAARLAFRGNQLGMVVTNSSFLRLDGATFEDNQVGYGQQNACDARLEHCVFRKCDTAVGLRQTRRSPAISFCTFQSNQTAVSARLFSHVLIEGSTFQDNRTAFDALNFCGAFLRYNQFQGNDQAIRLDKKSNARIVGNLITDSRVALFADYSSYPAIEGNHFVENEWHVRLGIYQSADWERRQGSRGLMMKEAKEANSRNPLMLSGDAPTGPNRFTVAGNAWDAQTEAEMGAGEDTNVTRFWDGRDQEPVRYEGFGEGSFAVDVIRFSPALPVDATATGPAAWRPLDIRAPAVAPDADVTGSRRPPPPAPDAAPRGRP